MILWEEIYRGILFCAESFFSSLRTMKVNGMYFAIGEEEEEEEEVGVPISCQTFANQSC